LPLPGFELRPLCCPACSQSLYRLRYPGPQPHTSAAFTLRSKLVRSIPVSCSQNGQSWSFSVPLRNTMVTTFVLSIAIMFCVSNYTHKHTGPSPTAFTTCGRQSQRCLSLQAQEHPPTLRVLQFCYEQSPSRVISHNSIRTLSGKSDIYFGGVEQC
jgi:hypothetical protein